MNKLLLFAGLPGVGKSTISKEEIEKTAKQLGFDIKNAIKKPVDTLFTEWRSANGLPFKPHMTFNDYDK